MPTRGDLWPPKLPRPAGALNGELGSFGGVGQQVDGHIDPQALGLYILDAQMEAAVLFPDVSLHTGNLDAELNAFRQGAEIGGDGNAAAGLGLAGRDAIDFREFRRIGEDRGLAVKLSD